MRTLAIIRTFSAPMSNFRTFQVRKNKVKFQDFSGPVRTLHQTDLSKSKINIKLYISQILQRKCIKLHTFASTF